MSISKSIPFVFVIIHYLEEISYSYLCCLSKSYLNGIDVEVSTTNLKLAVTAG